MSKHLSGWDPVAAWYDGWVGQHGSDHHRQLAIPALLELLQPQQGEHILDVGAGQGVLAPFIARLGAHYTGVDISPRLLNAAQKRHGNQGRFLRGDARHLADVSDLAEGAFDGVAFLLSIQDMDPLAQVLASTAWALRQGGRVVLLMTHPCFHVPRQSGWGRDERRALQYRRVDCYLTPLRVPLKAYPGRQGGATISFHRPLGEYVNGLADQGLVVDRLDEITTYQQGQSRAERRAYAEIPLFLGLRAWKVGVGDSQGQR